METFNRDDGSESLSESQCREIWKDHQKMNVLNRKELKWGNMGNYGPVIWCEEDNDKGDLGFHHQKMKFFKAIMDLVTKVVLLM